MTATATQSRNLPRLILAASMLIAMIAVGVALWKREKSPSPDAGPTEVSTPAADVGSMISQLEAKLKDNPDDAEGWRMLGWAFFETGKYGEAAAAYARATQINPQKAEYWSSLGEAKVLAGPGDVPADAKAAFERAVSIDAKDPRARYFLAVAKDIAGDSRGAVSDWIALLRDTPAGAPWEADVRRLVSEVASREKIDIADQLATLRPAPATGGAAIATAAIPGPSSEQMRAATAMPKGQQDMMIQGMVDGLEAKLKSNPDNVEGWIMLMRSRMQLGETAKASAALASARAAFRNDPRKIGPVNEAAQALGVR